MVKQSTIKNTTDKIIEVTNLVKDFGTFKAVNSISFSVNKGEIFAFLGPNGAGKSTTIKILTTLLQKTSGNIKVNGNDINENQYEIRKAFGIVFQDFSLDDELTAYENMDFHASLYNLDDKLKKERIEQLLKFVELWDRRNDIVKFFSGGMKRRLEIARALVHHPKLLYLDEPTIGLDPQTRNHIWEYIAKLSKEEGMTVFFTTHYMEEAEKIANRIAIIDKGNIVALGNKDELKKETSSVTLEESFLKLTGKVIREENASSKDIMRLQSRAWGRK